MLNLDVSTIKLINSDQLDGVLHLYEVTYDDAQPPKRWTDWTEPVTYLGQTWEPFAISHSDITTNSEGRVDPVTLTIGNIDEERAIQRLIEDYNLIGKPVKIYEVIVGMNPNDILTLGYEFRFAGAKAAKGKATFQLSLSFDFFNIEVPGRRVHAQFCSWGFKDEDCLYSGPDTVCERTFQDCLNKGNDANFGGFPGVMNQHFIL